MRIRDKAKAKLPPVEAGVYIAVCVGVVDIGQQYSEKFKSYRNEVLLVFELCGESVRIDGEDKPRQLSRTFSFSTSKKSNLRAFLSSWNGVQYGDEQFAQLELFDQVGRACQLNVTRSDSGEYANIDSVMPLPRGMTAPEPVSDLIRWDMDDWDDVAFEGLPTWAQERIRRSTQFQEFHTPEDVVGIDDTERTERTDTAGAARTDPAGKAGAAQTEPAGTGARQTAGAEEVPF